MTILNIDLFSYKSNSIRSIHIFREAVALEHKYRRSYFRDRLSYLADLMAELELSLKNSNFYIVEHVKIFNFSNFKNPHYLATCT